MMRYVQRMCREKVQLRTEQRSKSMDREIGTICTFKSLLVEPYVVDPIFQRLK
jgi:hypothetical protein